MKLITTEIKYKLKCNNCENQAIKDKELQTDSSQQLMRMFLCLKCWTEFNKLIIKKS